MTTNAEASVAHYITHYNLLTEPLLNTYRLFLYTLDKQDL